MEAQKVVVQNPAYFFPLIPIDVRLLNILLRIFITLIGKIMKLILENPYRILGLPVTASDREIAKRGDDLAMYIEMGITKKYEHDFLFDTNPISRTKESLQRALGQLELGNQKIFHSTFWFHNNSSVDQLVFELLNEGQLAKAEDIWNKQTSGEVNSKNASYYRNFSIFNILQLDECDHCYMQDFILQGKSFFQGSLYSHDQSFLQQIGGDNNRLDQTDVQLFLMEELEKHIFSTSGEGFSKNIQKEFLDIFNGADESIRTKAIKKFTDEPIHRLEIALDECMQRRKENHPISKIAADQLFSIAEKHLTNLEFVLSKSDIHYQFIADKIANELLECSTIYYNWFTKIDDSFKPLDISETISLKAKKMAVSDEVILKINKDLDTITDLRKQKKAEGISKEFVKAIKKLPSMEGISSSQIEGIPTSLKIFLDEVIPTLRIMKRNNEQEYRDWSEVFVNVALNYGTQYLKNASKPNFAEVLSILKKVQILYMQHELEQTFDQVFSIIKTRSEEKPSSGACYIATLVYGDYDSPEVLVLRKFRDTVLAKSKAGRLFIKFYYTTSPSLVKALRQQLFVQNGIRKILDSVVKRLSK